MPDIDNPFGEDDFDRIEAALAQSDKVERAIRKAQRAGIELPGQLEQVREARARMQSIKNTYFTGR